MSGVRINCIARSSLDPWMTIELARDIKLLGIIDSRYGKSIPRDPTHENGWDWVDQTYGTLAFFGPACQAAKPCSPRDLPD